MGLNPANIPDFVTVYIYDVLIFFKTLEDQYLGYMITPLGLQTNQRLVAAVKEFSRPKSVTHLK